VIFVRFIKLFFWFECFYNTKILKKEIALKIYQHVVRLNFIEVGAIRNKAEIFDLNIFYEPNCITTMILLLRRMEHPVFSGTRVL